MTEEYALWQAIGAAPEDQLPRLVAADWYDERAGMADCPLCKGDEQFGRPCKVCKATGRVSNGHAEMAAALRATADRVPQRKHGYWRWRRDGAGDMATPFRLPVACWATLCGFQFINKHARRWSRHTTPENAIRDLCRAWVASRSKQEVST